MSRRLENKRVLVTCADKYMGPAIEKLFKAEGALVQTSVDSPPGSGECGRCSIHLWGY